MNHAHLAQALTESFNALADEVQSLIDRKTILEHKLRFAHEQYQYLADKYAPAAPEVSETLAKIQLPPEIHHHRLVDPFSTVPLPRRDQLSNQHQIALLIRDGRKAAQQLLAAGDESRGGDTSNTASSSLLPPVLHSMASTMALEYDFTVEGKKGPLSCPFSPAPPSPPSRPADENMGSPELTGTTADPTPHKSSDPICAAMAEEVLAVPAPTASQCPIRFLDKHSPEEVARYVQSHKHEIPRSHEVCVRRYQKNEEQIRKLDAKYGNLVSMINDLGTLHQPMLPSAAADEDEDDVDRLSNQRVAHWASAVVIPDPEEEVEKEVEEANNPPASDDDDDGGREGHFNRPLLRAIRVGESPSRPWGISVPVAAAAAAPPTSPPPAPVSLELPTRTANDPSIGGSKKCPFDHSKFSFASPLPMMPDSSSAARHDEDRYRHADGLSAPPTKDRMGTGESFDHQVYPPFAAAQTKDRMTGTGEESFHHHPATYPKKDRVPPSLSPEPPTFVDAAQMVAGSKADGAAPQVVFNITGPGPVFIGYPMEQAAEFMRRYQRQ
ncbi:hypothetical protein QBC39DRAFT_347729 [Podospora conica]|nr:hypothetical protein QBC39DRAFT_347729 [Schizothecium conicum]